MFQITFHAGGLEELGRNFHLDPPVTSSILVAPPRSTSSLRRPVPRVSPEDAGLHHEGRRRLPNLTRTWMTD